MLSGGPSDLLHLVGFLTGTILYGMLVVMVARPPARPDAFALSTGVLGLIWNVGELAAYAARWAQFSDLASWINAFSFTALGFLASVVMHSVARNPAKLGSRQAIVAALIAIVVYASAALAGTMHFMAASSGAALPSPLGLTWLTIGLIAAIPPLVLLTRQQLNSVRALWMAALAVVAVSALHLGRFHGTQESWPVEVVGHHASIILVFAILYQDYRFALADLFLKQALTLLALVALVFGTFSVVEPVLVSVDGHLSSAGIAALLAMCAGTALIFPLCRHAVTWFVDRVVLARADYTLLVSRLTDELQDCESPAAVLDRACAILSSALTADRVTWATRSLVAPGRIGPHEVPIWTGEPPQYMLTIDQLAGGRRLLSDDVGMLERAAVIVARRIDALRLTSERYERMLQEREMRSLATEAELRALRAQINPHFLFNTLTTIGYLIQQAPPRALKTLLNLTTLLRSVLKSEGEFTTLGRERELIESYLHIECERFEERLVFVLDIPTELSSQRVPSLIVQPLVENAVKHGIGGAKDGGTLSVVARMEEDLRISVRNTGAPLGSQTEPGAGVGLDNVRRRLHHYYGDAASLTIRRDVGGATVAELSLPATSDTEAEEHEAVLARNATR